MVRRKIAQLSQITRESLADQEARFPALKALLDATLDKQRGFVLSRSEAIRLAGGEKEFAKVANKWKNAIVALRGITVEYKHKHRGYRFIPVQEHMTERHLKILESTEDKHREEGARLGAIRNDDIENDYGRRLRALVMHQHFDVAGKANSQLEYARIGIRQPESLPRLPLETPTPQ